MQLEPPGMELDLRAPVRQPVIMRMRTRSLRTK
jgi:hypothetical protein